MTSHSLYTVADIRQIERSVQAELAPRTLMQRAGRVAAEYALHLLSTHANPAVLLLAGPGNNGGDAFEMATHLAEAGCEPTVMFVGEPAALPADAVQAFKLAQAHTGIHVRAPDPRLIAAQDWALVVDGLFGIGLSRPIQGMARTLIEAVNILRCPVLALDVPSGLHADTGCIIGGMEGIAIRATHTVTFIGDKPGLHTSDGRDHAGRVRVEDPGIDRTRFPVTKLQLNGVELFSSALQPRLQNSHKGSYGDVTVLGGARGTVGAAILAARTALKCGAGRVFIASPDAALAYDDTQPELMCRDAHQVDFDKGVIAAGPGLGVTREAHDLLNKAIASRCPLVLDADALNLMTTESALQQKLRSRRAPALLTPHPLEAARLLGTTTQEVQNDRLAAARLLASRFNACLVLKGSGTVIALPDGRIVINSTGNPALATAGSGDVLSGLCAALLAQGWAADAAACGAVWLHGRAADDLVESGVGPIGVTAGELIPAIRFALNRLVLLQPSSFRQDVRPRS